MARPVMNRLFFAGEATTREHPATVAGACITGLREVLFLLLSSTILLLLAYLRCFFFWLSPDSRQRPVG
jgi:hypothetical protein